MALEGALQVEAMKSNEISVGTAWKSINFVYYLKKEGDRGVGPKIEIISADLARLGEKKVLISLASQSNARPSSAEHI